MRPNFKGHCKTDKRSAWTFFATRGKEEGFVFRLDQRDNGDSLEEAVTVHCFARQDGTLMTRVTVKGHKPIELVTNRG